MTIGNFTRALVVWFLMSLVVFFTGGLTGLYARNLVVALIVTVVPVSLALQALIRPLLRKRIALSK